MDDLPSRRERERAGLPDWIPSHSGQNRPASDAVYLAWVADDRIVGQLFVRPGTDRQRVARRLVNHISAAVADDGVWSGPPHDVSQLVNHIELVSGDASGSGRGHGWALHEPEARSFTLGEMLAYAQTVLGRDE
ncbi:MAG TPA: hypothetical protein VIK61_11225 [Acidimicrobiia bacterium]